MSTNEEMAALRAEIAGLRRWLRLLVALVLVVVVTAVLLLAWNRLGGLLDRGSQPVGALEVSAQEYRLLDPDGNLRGLWHCPPAGPSLSILDKDGRLAVEVALTPGGGGTIRLREGGRVVFQRP
jgi:hypothetical protein